MRLINVRTLGLEYFGDNPPKYAILSHRWASEELSYQDFQNPWKCTGPSFDKILNFCRLVRYAAVHPDSKPYEGGQVIKLDWCWIDTVCIDKSSSAELSEAINSMWKYYRDAVYCVAYLADVSTLQMQEVFKSDWFTRGWTLQELLAPRHVSFYNQAWQRLGEKDLKSTLALVVAAASGVPLLVLNSPDRYSETSVAQRMSWAAKRTTERKEDRAYSLMGLFDVNMPLLYGEGEQKAFQRLQRAIIEQSDDESIFVFEGDGEILAENPRAFQKSDSVFRRSRVKRDPYVITHKGLRIEGPALRLGSPWSECFLMKLNCVQRIIKQESTATGEAPHTVTSQGCVLGLVQDGDNICRHPRLEQAALTWTSDEVQEHLERQEWEKVERVSFLVSLSSRESTYGNYPSDGDSAVAEVHVQSPMPIPCVDDEGPYYSGIRRNKHN